jgi:hypothetical protein
MGSRASYVVIEHCAIAVYSSHWGAMSVPSVIVGGPAETLAYVRGLQAADGLHDTTWSEGGILLDADTHTLIFWGGLYINSRPYLRRLFLPVVRLIWQGWSVSWAARGVVDLAEYPGVAQVLDMDPASVIDTRVSSVWDPYPESEVRNPHEQPGIGTVATVKWEDGGVTDYSFQLLANYRLVRTVEVIARTGRTTRPLPPCRSIRGYLALDGPDARTEGVYLVQGPPA